MGMGMALTYENRVEFEEYVCAGRVVYKYCNAGDGDPCCVRTRMMAMLAAAMHLHQH